MLQSVDALSAPGACFRTTGTTGSSMERTAAPDPVPPGSCAHSTPTVITNPAAASSKEELFISGLLSHENVDFFDLVPQISRRIPEALEGLRLADAVRRPCHDAVLPPCRSPGIAPLDPGILAHVSAELRRAPGPSPVRGHNHVLDG